LAVAAAVAGCLWAQEATDAPESVLFEPLPAVEAATLHSQTLEEAPASVTVISGGRDSHVRLAHVGRGAGGGARVLHDLRSHL